MSEGCSISEAAGHKGASVDEGQIIAEGASSKDGQLALGVNCWSHTYPFRLQHGRWYRAESDCQRKIDFCSYREDRIQVPNGALPEVFL